MTNEHVTPFKHIIISKPLKVETFQFWQFQLSFIQKGTEHIRLLTFKDQQQNCPKLDGFKNWSSKLQNKMVCFIPKNGFRTEVFLRFK